MEVAQCEKFIPQFVQKSAFGLLIVLLACFFKLLEELYCFTHQSFFPAFSDKVLKKVTRCSMLATAIIIHPVQPYVVEVAIFTPKPNNNVIMSNSTDRIIASGVSRFPCDQVSHLLALTLTLLSRQLNLSFSIGFPFFSIDLSIFLVGFLKHYPLHEQLFSLHLTSSTKPGYEGTHQDQKLVYLHLISAYFVLVDRLQLMALHLSSNSLYTAKCNIPLDRTLLRQVKSTQAKITGRTTLNGGQ